MNPKTLTKSETGRTYVGERPRGDTKRKDRLRLKFTHEEKAVEKKWWTIWKLDDLPSYDRNNEPPYFIL